MVHQNDIFLILTTTEQYQPYSRSTPTDHQAWTSFGPHLGPHLGSPLCCKPPRNGSTYALLESTTTPNVAEIYSPVALLDLPRRLRKAASHPDHPQYATEGLVSDLACRAAYKRVLVASPMLRVASFHVLDASMGTFPHHQSSYTNVTTYLGISSPSSIMSAQEHEMWDDLNIQYEHAYRDNPFKKACVQHAIANLKPESRVLDVGCGTGVPVAKMLADAKMRVVGTDVAPKMVAIAQKKVEGDFQVADMVDYQPEGTFDAVFVIYSQLGLTYAAFHKAAYKFAQALRPGGLFVIGQSATDDDVPSNDTAWDATHSYVEGYNLPFWGEPFPTLMFTRQAQRSFLESMGLTVIYDTLDDFQPDNPKCDVEHQQYIIARLDGDRVMGEPIPAPCK